MKSYLRRSPLLNPTMVFGGAVLCAVVAAALYIFTRKLSAICIGLLVVLLILWLFVILAVQHRYRYNDDGITFHYLNVPYKKEAYHNIRAIVISNAAYNNGYGYGINGNVQMQRHGAARAFTKALLPFITLHTDEFKPNELHAGMYSREIRFLAPDQTFCLGICWFDSLRELLSRTNGTVYLLEDVYLRFQSNFDEIMKLGQIDKCRIHIISS